MTSILPDECDLIKIKLQELIDMKNPTISAIITTGKKDHYGFFQIVRNVKED